MLVLSWILLQCRLYLICLKMLWPQTCSYGVSIQYTENSMHGAKLEVEIRY
jgi:hypothetical protein